MLSLGCRDTGAGVLGCEYVAERRNGRRALDRWYRASNKSTWCES